MHNQIGRDRRQLLRVASVDDQLVAALLDRRDGRAHAYVNAELTGGLDESRHEVAVEALERTVAAVDDRHVGACARGDVRELEGDVAAPDEDDSARQLLQVQELGTGRQVLLPAIPSGACRAPAAITT